MIAAETSEVQFGLTRIPYGVRRSTRRRTVSIAIDPREGVLLTAPAGVPLERLDRVVHEKARWIVDKLRRQSDRPPPLPAREFVSGETFLYLGRQYRLRVEPRPSMAGGVELLRGWLVTPVPETLTGSARAERARSKLVAWYQARAAHKLPVRASLWANKLGIPVPDVRVREPRKRWGSCDAKGQVRFNWRIVQAPMRLVDYVVAHELVHLEHPDHTGAFWARLGWVMPDYEARRAALRAMGPGLAW
jgi:predicted metal-dependent hydrolase